MKLLKTYLVAVTTVCEFGLFGGLNHQPAQLKMNWRRIHHSAASAKKVLEHIFSYQFD